MGLCSGSTAATKGFVTNLQAAIFAPPFSASDEFETAKYCQIEYENLSGCLIQPSLTSTSTSSSLPAISRAYLYLYIYIYIYNIHENIL